MKKNIWIIISLCIYTFFSCKEQTKTANASSKSEKQIKLNPTKEEWTFQHRDSSNKYQISGLDKAIKKDYQGGVNDLDNAIAFTPWDKMLYESRGLIKLEAQNYQEAILDFDKSIELDTTGRYSYKMRPMFVEGEGKSTNSYSRVHCHRARAKAASGFNSEAMKDYNIAIEVEPGYSGNYYQRGNFKIKLGDIRGGILDFSKAIELKPDYLNAYNDRGRAKMFMKEFAESLNDFNKAIELQPNDGLVLYNRGIAKLNLNDKEGACLDWSNAGENGYQEAYEMINQHCN